ncbi:MAG: hypothetical protein NVV59_01155 [Chitinophagaceae bacterium]|nr:hypothetical protein [Chitinophagaceae bacterium]
MSLVPPGGNVIQAFPIRELVFLTNMLLLTSTPEILLKYRTRLILQMTVFIQVAFILFTVYHMQLVVFLMQTLPHTKVAHSQR